MSISRGFQTAGFSESTAATFTLAPPPGHRRYRVRGLLLSAAGAVAARLKSGASTVIAPFQLAAVHTLHLELTDGGPGEAWAQGAEDEALTLELEGAVVVSGIIFYDTVRA